MTNHPDIVGSDVRFDCHFGKGLIGKVAEFRGGRVIVEAYIPDLDATRRFAKKVGEVTITETDSA